MSESDRSDPDVLGAHVLLFSMRSEAGMLIANNCTFVFAESPSLGLIFLPEYYLMSL